LKLVGVKVTEKGKSKRGGEGGIPTRIDFYKYKGTNLERKLGGAKSKGKRFPGGKNDEDEKIGIRHPPGRAFLEPSSNRSKRVEEVIDLPVSARAERQNKTVSKKEPRNGSRDHRTKDRLENQKGGRGSKRSLLFFSYYRFGL